MDVCGRVMRRNQRQHRNPRGAPREPIRGPEETARVNKAQPTSTRARAVGPAPMPPPPPNDAGSHGVLPNEWRLPDHGVHFRQGA